MEIGDLGPQDIRLGDQSRYGHVTDGERRADLRMTAETTSEVLYTPIYY
jgi:hypothetical protein